jgi:protein-tyrosine-phosphatase
MAHILFVCTANICRSPVAEALLRSQLELAGYGDWVVSSAGTWADRGEPASEHSVQLLSEMGLDISAHRSRPVDAAALAEADLVLTLEMGHAEALRAEFPRHAHKIRVLSQMSGPAYSVGDPYGGPRASYERMVREVGGLIERGLPQIVETADQNERRRQVLE